MCVTLVGISCCVMNVLKEFAALFFSFVFVERTRVGTLCCSGREHPCVFIVMYCITVERLYMTVDDLEEAVSEPKPNTRVPLLFSAFATDPHRPNMHKKNTKIPVTPPKRPHSGPYLCRRCRRQRPLSSRVRSWPLWTWLALRCPGPLSWPSWRCCWPKWPAADRSSTTRTPAVPQCVDGRRST